MIVQDQALADKQGRADSLCLVVLLAIGVGHSWACER